MSGDGTTPRKLTPSQAVTPAVLRAVRDAITPTTQTTFADAQCVLRHLARWCRNGEVAEAISQIAAGTLISERVVKRCLKVLDDAGVARVSARGGGRQRMPTRRVLWLDWYGDDTIRGPHETADNPNSGQRMAPVALVDNEELGPTDGPSSDGNSGHDDANSGHSQSNSGHIAPNSGHQVAHTDLLPTLDPTQPPLTPPQSELTVDQLAGEAGRKYAIDEKARGRDVRSIPKLAAWQKKELLEDEWSVDLIGQAIERSERFKAWAGRPIEAAKLAEAVLAGSLASLHPYPPERPAAPVLNVVAREPEPVLSDTEREAARIRGLEAAGIPEHLIRRTPRASA